MAPDAKRKDAPEADADALAAAVEAAKRKAAARRQTIWQEDPQARGVRRLHGARPAPKLRRRLTCRLRRGPRRCRS
jgi:hypothetical protein